MLKLLQLTVGGRPYTIYKLLNVYPNHELNYLFGKRLNKCLKNYKYKSNKATVSWTFTQCNFSDLIFTVKKQSSSVVHYFRLK